MHLIQSFFRRIMKDLRQKKLIPLKILFFVHASTLFVLYPYLTIHMRELGINVEETAIMSAVSPVVFIVMPPLAGMLADKVGNFRLLLALSSVMGGLSALLLLTVPVGRITVTYPPVTEMLVTCDAGTMRLQHLYDHACQPVHPYPYNINLTILSCGLLCVLPDYISREESDAMILTQSYDVNLRAPDGKRLMYRHTISPFLMRSNELTKDQKFVRILTNNAYFESSASKISDTEVFIPIPQIYEMECVNNSSNTTCFFDNHDIFSDHATKEGAKFQATVSHELQEKTDDAKSFSIKAISTGNVTSFDDDFSNNVSKCSVEVDLEASVRAGSREISQCSMACAAVTPRKSLCKNLKQQIEFDPVFTFWTYLAVRVFIGIISGTAFAMFEGAVIAILREQSADYGLQRMYGSIGGMISSPLSGMLIDYASRGKGYTDFRPAFYLYAVLKVASGVLMLSIDLEFKQPAQNLIADVISVLKNIELMALLIACFIMGTAWGYIESFLFWLLQDMGASRSLMGVTITVGGIAGLPLLVLSGPIIRKLGHANVIFIGFVFYAIRLLGYSLIYNPWLCLIFEALESVTSSLSFTAAVTYAARLSSTTTDTSVQGMLGGIYYGVGKGSGSLIGGYMMKFFGTRPTYQIFSGATLITGCVYILFNQLFIRKRAMDDSNDICKKKPAVNPLNVESHEAGKETDKSMVPIEDARNDVILERIVNGNVSTVDGNQQKLTADNIDGGSDSGVDNPAYHETENSEINVSNKKINNPAGQ